MVSVTVNAWFASSAVALTVGVATGPNAAGVTIVADVPSADRVGDLELTVGDGPRLVTVGASASDDVIGGAGAEPTDASTRELGVKSTTVVFPPDGDEEPAGSSVGTEPIPTFAGGLAPGEAAGGLDFGSTVMVTEGIVRWTRPPLGVPPPLNRSAGGVG